MILYRLAKWMEERKRLKRLIAETDGDSSFYIKQKEIVERRMLLEAYQWLEPSKATPQIPAVMLDLGEWEADKDTEAVPELLYAASPSRDEAMQMQP